MKLRSKRKLVKQRLRRRKLLLPELTRLRLRRRLDSPRSLLKSKSMSKRPRQLLTKPRPLRSPLKS